MIVPTPPVSTTGPREAPQPPDAKVKHVAEEFEAVLLGQLLKGLRRTVPEGEEVSSARQMYNELLDEALATEIARKGGIGLADVIRAYMSRTAAPRTEGHR